jgi:nucleotide-binding universal stress UspA family protein
MKCKKILVAVDASDNAMRAVHYTGEIVGDRPEFLIELLTIERLPARDLFPDEAAWKTACENTRAELRRFQDKAAFALQETGVPGQTITKRYITSCHSPLTGDATQCSPGTSIAQEILQEVKNGDFGTVVIGRRGVSKAEEFLFGSVSTKIIHYARGCAVWVVE